MIQQLILNGLIAGSIYALIALGFTVIYKRVRFFPFAHGVVYTPGAYVAYSVVSHSVDFCAEGKIRQGHADALG